MDLSVFFNAYGCQNKNILCCDDFFNSFNFLFTGLFSKAIAQSGTNLAAWSQPAHKGVARHRATKLAEMFKCHTPNNWPKTLDCLRTVSAENITAAFYDFFKWDTGLTLIYHQFIIRNHNIFNVNSYNAICFYSYRSNDSLPTRC